MVHVDKDAMDTVFRTFPGVFNCAAVFAIVVTRKPGTCFASGEATSAVLPLQAMLHPDSLWITPALFSEK
jgi:hypothetical protein